MDLSVSRKVYTCNRCALLEKYLPYGDGIPHKRLDTRQDNVEAIFELINKKV